MHVRTLTAGLAAALGAGLLMAPATPAAAYAPPTILTPSAGETVSGIVDVTAATDAPYLLVRVLPSSSSRTTYIQQVVPVTGGQGTWAAPSWGFNEYAWLIVAPCDTTESSSCDLFASTEAPMPVDNPIDAVDVPTLGTHHYPAYDEPIVVTVTDDGEGVTRISHGSRQVATVQPGQPTELVFDHADYNRFASGVLTVVRCSQLTSNICSRDHVDAQNFTVRKGLWYYTESLSRRRISPNGDGVGDAFGIRVFHWTDTAELASAQWSLLTEDGEEVTAPQSLPAPVNAPDSYVVAADPYAAGATDLAEGDYVVRFRLTAIENGREFSMAFDVPVTVDLTGPQVTITPNLTQFFPAKDFYRGAKDYLNEIKFRYSVAPEPGIPSGTLNYATFAIVDAEGRHADQAREETGALFSWDGGNTRLRPEGDYRLRITGRDSAGNESVTFSEPIALSHDHYARRTKKKVVKARPTLWRNWSGRCGLLRKPGVAGGPGSVGYYSNGRCATANVERGVAEGAHRLRLPAADWYNTLRFRINGGPVKRYHRAGFLTISNQNTALGKPKALDSSWGWHRKETRKGDQMIWPDGSVYWLVNTGYGQRYDVRRFEILMEYADWTGEPGTEPYAPQVSGRHAREPASATSPRPTPIS